VALSFEPNLGQVKQAQTPDAVQWVARGPEYALFLSGHDAVLELNSIAAKKGIGDRPRIESAAVRMNLLGAETVKATEGEEPQAGKANYFTGRDQAKWLSGVPMFGRVRLREVYPGIDLVYYGRQGRLEYDFVVRPGADPAKIALGFEGAKAGVAPNGDLVLPIAGGESWAGEKEIRFDKPAVYQMNDGVRQPVAGGFRVAADGRVSFALGEYDRSRELVIDPTLVFEGEIGTGNQQTVPTGMTIDSIGEMVITGYTNDLTFPVTTGAYQTTCSSPTDMLVVEGGSRCGVSSSPSAFVTKLSADGTSLLYSTYLHGGAGYEQGQSVAVDAAGDAYVLGSTSSNDFPITANAFQTLCQPVHQFLGFSYPQYGPSVSSQCDNFADGGGTEYTVNGPNLFIAELDPTGTSLLYSTFFGGSAPVYPVGIALDGANNIYFASNVNPGLPANNLYVNNQNSGEVQFPVTSGAYQTAGIGLQEPALSVLSADGQTLLYSTFLGSMTSGQGTDTVANTFALGQNGIMFVGGWTYASDFPTTAGSIKPSCTLNTNNALSCSNAQGYVAAIDTTKSGASSLVYSTYLGGSAAQGSNIPEQQVYGLAADASNDLFVTGYTYANDFPTTSGTFQASCPVQGNSGSCPQTAFLTKINPAGSALTWSTFVGGTSANPASSYGNAIALDGPGNVYLYGFSQDGGGDFPQVNPLQPYSGGNKVFLTTFTPDGTKELFGTRFGTSSTTTGSGTTPIANGIALDATGNMYIVGYTNDNGTFGTTAGTYSTPATNGFNRTFFAKISPATGPTPANPITTNLLLNPGAELGSIVDWTPGGGGTPTVDQGTFDPGIDPHTGSYDFVGGSDNPTDSLSQTVSLITEGITAAQVDGGTLFASVSFWEQGLDQGTTSDNGSVTVTFLNGSGTALGTATTATVDSHNGTWTNGTGVYAIPAGTRSITYTMNFMRNVGSDNDAFFDDNSLQVVSDTGLTISPAVLDFGNVAVGQTSAAQTATLTNQQPSMATINISQIVSELGANPADFVETNNCPGALAAGASCTVTITFTPGGVGAASAGIAVFDDSVPALQQITVEGTGTGGILQVNPGNLKTIAGNGTNGYSGDGGLATAAELEQPNGVAFDPAGNFYVVDTEANVVRKVAAGTGIITTFAGDGTGGFSGDGGPATQAELLIPFSVASDKNGNIYIQDTGNSVIRKVDTTGKITTFAGTPGVNGHAGDGGPATAATFNENQGARFDAAGNFYVPQCDEAAIRKIDTTGKISTVAGNFTEGFSGDGGQATAAQLYCPSGVAIDAAGNFYIADEFNQVIRKVTAATGVISTIAGTPGVAGDSGDGGPATAATFNLPNDVVIDAAGNLYVADSANNRVRKIDTNGVITTAAGGLNSAGSAAVNTPLAATVDTANNVYFSDSGNSKVEEIFPEGTTPFPATVVGSTAPAQTVTISNIGNVAVTIPSGSFTTSGNAADFALAGGTCLAGATLAANGGACTLTITFTPTAAGLRSLTVTIASNALNTPQSFVIGGIGTAPALVTPTITWPAPGNIVYGTPLGAAQLDAVATGVNGVPVAGTFVYTPAAGTVLGVGTQGLSVTFTPTPAAYGPATAFNSITVTQFTPVITWPTPAAITTATALTSAQLDAAATDVNGNAIPGVYTYSPAAGTLLAAGTQTLSVTFTPTDTLDFTTATKTVQIVVNQAAAATVTTLAVDSGGEPATTVAAGSVVTLTARVTAGGNSVSPGQVEFCDATATSCTDIHLLGTVQLVGGDASSTATYRFVPGIGAHSYKAVFLGTNNAAGSASAASALAVTGLSATTTALASTGVEGSYALTATVAGFGLGSPSGSVVFTDSSTNATLGTVPVTGVVRGFVSGGPITVGSSPNQVVSADVNGDGKLDLVVANQSGAMVTVLIGNGDGTYTASPSFGNNNGGVGIAVGDFNGDGKLDIATANGSSVGIFLGNGDGTFGTEQDFANTGSSKGVSAADVNGDGKLDLIVTDNGSGITIMIGNGDGTFTQPNPALGTGGGPNFQLAVADFNGDGKLDIAFGNKYDNTLSLLLGNGDGTFQPQIVIPAGSAPKGCFAGDFNGDGHQDIILTNGNGSSISVLLGNGDGTFQAEQTFAVGPNPWGAAVGDLNGDGKLDVAVANQDDGTVSVLFGNGDGTFQPQQVIASSGAESVAIGDANGDGSPDIAVPNSGSNTAAVFLNQATVALSLTGVTLPGTDMDSVVAMYSGDAVFAASTSNTLTLPSNPVGATVIAWTPAVGTIVYGTPLGASQLNASAATAAGATIAGTFVYTPAAGTLLGAGTHTLTVAFTPASANYATATATATITVTPATPVITWAAPAGITYGTALGAAQLDATVAGVGTGALAGTLVYTPAAGTVLPLGTQTLSVAFTPTDALDYTTAAASVPIVVVPALTGATLIGPSTTPPASQPTVTLQITNPYPLALTAQFTLAFAGAAGVDDPSIQFSAGGRTYSYMVAANSTSVPPVQLQAGTDAGTITITAKLLAAGVDVTPAGLAPLVIVVPPAVPVISGTTITASGNTLTVVVHGFSNTREVSQAVFDFTAATGDAVATPTVTIPATALFGAWFGSTESVAYGSTFTYTQVFTTSADASTVGQVKVTLTNSVGVSAAGTGP
jgi:sugar lactone lactonase YvrE